MADCGLVVLGVENPEVHSFVCDVRIHAGPRFERQDEAGLTHFLEHMLAQGSKKFPDSNELMRAVEDIGGALDPSTGPETLQIELGVHRKHWRRGLEILIDVLRHPLFEESEIENEKRIVAQELGEYRDEHQRNICVAELAYTLLFKDELDELGTRGDLATLQSFDRNMVQAQYERYMRPDNMVISVAGAFDFDEVFDELAGSLGVMRAAGEKPASSLPALVPPPLARRRARCIHRRTQSQPIVDAELFHYAWGQGDERYHVVRAGTHILGGGLSSRLFTRVREDLGLVYHIMSFTEGYSDAGAVVTTLSVDAANLAAAVAATLETVEAVREGGITEAELERHKETVRCGAEIMCDDSHRLAHWFGRQEFLLRPERLITPQEYVARQEALTCGRVGEVMGEVLEHASANMAVVGPFGEGEGEDLRKLFPAEEADAAG
ncbi:MAG: pitrilysin family protein [Candidatus Brocadiia bacterium]|nr:pitrilysin family protein [Candidatus Brocadiia bacterium]